METNSALSTVYMYDYVCMYICMSIYADINNYRYISMLSFFCSRQYTIQSQVIHKVTEATLMSRLLYASPAWWGLTTTKDKLNLERQQRKLIKMKYLPDKETTFAKKVHTAEEKLFKKMISRPNEEHVLSQFLPPKKEDKYSLRPEAHCFQLPVKDGINFIPRILYSTLNQDKILC